MNKKNVNEGRINYFIFLNVLQIENVGDFWVDFDNFQLLMYWECMYFLLVIMLIVGYGDVGVKIVLGKIFIVFFIMISIVSVNFSYFFLYIYD